MDILEPDDQGAQVLAAAQVEVDVAQRGDAVELIDGDAIATGKGGTAELLFEDGSI